MTYEELSQMYEPSDPKLWSLLEPDALGLNGWPLDLPTENPSYGPGNPDWEYDRHREQYDLTEADLYPEEMVSGGDADLSAPVSEGGSE
jgi:hypothetical protein